VSEKELKLVTIWQSYQHERDRLVHFVHLAKTLKNKLSAQNCYVLACSFAKYSPILNFFDSWNWMDQSSAICGYTIAQTTQANI